MRSVTGFCAIIGLLVGAHGFVAPSKLAAPLSISPNRASVHSTMIMDNPLFLVPPSATEWLSSSLSVATEDIVEAVTYSKASYYTVLGLYLMSFPGLWSQIKRSTTAKMKRKTYISPGEKADGGGKDLRQQAGEIMACKYQ
jgi:Cofactor assembly of complex C subunit B